jgi:hypothetical protein
VRGARPRSKEQQHDEKLINGAKIKPDRRCGRVLRRYISGGH